MERPKIVVYQMASVDGRLAVSPGTLLLFGDKRWNSAAGTSQKVWEEIKRMHQPQAILEGSGSFCPDDAIPSDLPPVEGPVDELYQDFLPEQVVYRPGARGWFTVVDGRGRVRWFYKEFPDEAWTGWHLMVLVSESTPPEYLAYLRRETIPYLVAGEDRVDLSRAVEKMKTLLGVETIVSEAGGRLNGALLRRDLIDEVNIELFPALIGGSKTPTLFDGEDLTPDEPLTRLALIHCNETGDGHIWLRYEVLR